MPRQPRVNPYEDVTSESAHNPRASETSATSAVDENRLIHVFVPTSDNPKHLMCPRCRVPPLANELQTSECSTCHSKLAGKFHRLWSPWIVGRLLIIFFVVFLFIGAAVMGVYLLATEGRREMPELLSNTSGQCKFYDVEEWGPWTECSKSCGNGTHTRHRTVWAQGTGCAPTDEYAPCFDRPCCPHGWTAPKNVTNNDWCYKPAAERNTREEAVQHCRAMQAELARAPDKEHQEFMSHITIGEDLWVGLRLRYGNQCDHVCYLNEEDEELFGIYVAWAKDELLMKPPSEGQLKHVFSKTQDGGVKWSLTDGSEEKLKKSFGCQIQSG